MRKQKSQWVHVPHLKQRAISASICPGSSPPVTSRKVFGRRHAHRWVLVLRGVWDADSVQLVRRNDVFQIDSVR